MIIKPASAYVIGSRDVGLPFSFDTLGDVISSLLPAVVALAGLASFAYLISGGLRWLTAGGDPKAISDASKIITNAIIGLVIVFIAWWLIAILETVLGIDITGFRGL